MSIYITVSRKWSNPKIRTDINNDGIALSMDIEDFKSALREELGSPALVMTKKALAGKIDSAIDAIVRGIKAESSKVVGRNRS